jgi:hypothetical protein
MVKNVVDQWIKAANITSGNCFRRVHKMGKTWGETLNGKGGLAAYSLGIVHDSFGERPSIFNKKAGCHLTGENS